MGQQLGSSRHSTSFNDSFQVSIWQENGLLQPVFLPVLLSSIQVEQSLFGAIMQRQHIKCLNNDIFWSTTKFSSNDSQVTVPVKKEGSSVRRGKSLKNTEVYKLDFSIDRDTLTALREI